jgi:hypothetical protein
VCPPREAPKGKRPPLPPEPRHQGLRRPQRGRHVAISAHAPNPCALRHLCPCAALDPTPTPRDRAPAGLPPTALGFSHSPVPPPREERGGREGGEGEEEEGGRVTTTARQEDWRSSVNRSRSRQDRSCRAEGESRPCSRSRSRGSVTAVYHFTGPPVFPEPDTPTSPPQRELRSHPPLPSTLVSFL